LPESKIPGPYQFLPFGLVLLSSLALLPMRAEAQSASSQNAPAQPSGGPAPASAVSGSGSSPAPASGASASNTAGVGTGAFGSAVGGVIDFYGLMIQGVQSAQKSIQGAAGLNVHGLIAMGYESNFDYPYTGNNLYRAFDYFGANNFELIQGELHIDHTAANEPGFVLDVNTANTAQVMYGLTTYYRAPGPTGVCPQTPCGWLDATQAFLTYTIPIGNGIVVTAGRQYGLVGYEGLPDWQTTNLFESIGLLYNLGEPFTVTGVRALYAFNEKLSAILGLNSGWDTIASRNALQNLESRVVITPASWLSWTINDEFGPTQPQNTALREMVDSFVTYTPPIIPGLSITEEAYYASQQGPAEILPEFPFIVPAYIPHSVHWWGDGVWIAYNITNRLQAGLRGEYFDDADGFRTGILQQLWEITFGLNYKLTKQTMVRWEFRHDQSTDSPFPTHANEPDLAGMNTMLWTAMYSF
jgi:hypothetical protein